jgi:acyl-CoA thioesterase FadM
MTTAATPPLRAHALRIETSGQDLPEDRFSDHVNNARYFAFINRAFQSWYRAMGIRGGVPGQTAVMAHVDWDFLREVKPPATVEVRLEVVKVGRTSMEHAVEIIDLGVGAAATEHHLAGRGRVRHVWFDRDGKRPLPWPDEVLARCWDGVRGA